MLSALIDSATEAIVVANHDPDSFTMDRHSVDIFMLLNFDIDVEHAGTVIDGPYFDCILDEEILRLTTDAVIIEDEKLDIMCRLYYLKDYKGGNREWLVYDYDIGEFKKAPEGYGFNVENLF